MFLILVFHVRLLQILGPGMSNKVWEATLEHARTCVLDATVYVYFPRPNVKNGVVFNVVGQVTGLLRDGQYILVDKLSELEKVGSCSPTTYIVCIHFILFCICLLFRGHLSNVSRCILCLG